MLASANYNHNNYENNKPFHLNLPIFLKVLFCKELPNGLRYLRWGGDGEAVQPEE